jgi:hypothetical protein
MASISYSSLAIPAAANSKILKMKSEKVARVAIKLRNLGSNDAVLKVRESEEDSTYADISGATVTVKPGGVADLNYISHKPFQLITGSGDTYCKADIAYEGSVLFGNIDMIITGRKAFGDE